MNFLAKALIGFVVVFHLLVFVVEAFLWMQPGVHEFVLSRLGSTFAVDVHVQAAILKRFLVNQGFYNLFLALAGIAGFRLLRRGNARAGYTLIVYMCLSALGAGVVLALSTHAYVGAFLQAVPAAGGLAALTAVSVIPDRR
jgi:putative membrane protein